MRQFPILMPYRDSERAELIRLGCPTSVPWDLVAAHEQQARANHGGQSVARLAERGGLSVVELVAVLRDQLLRAPFPAEAESVPALLTQLELDARRTVDAWLRGAVDETRTLEFECGEWVAVANIGSPDARFFSAPDYQRLAELLANDCTNGGAP